MWGRDVCLFCVGVSYPDTRRGNEYPSIRFVLVKIILQNGFFLIGIFPEIDLMFVFMGVFRRVIVERDVIVL